MPIFPDIALDREGFLEVLRNNTGVVILKFGAEWCGPCGRIKDLVHVWAQKVGTRSDVSFFYIDVDDSFDLFAHLKSKKIVPGIPALLLYRAGNLGFAPDNVYIGTDAAEIGRFFETI